MFTKYRVWDINKSVMLPWEEIQNWPISKVFEDTDYIPMQFIGNDMSNAGEYEGDVIHGVYRSMYDHDTEYDGKEFYSVYKHDQCYSGYSLQYPGGAVSMIYCEEACVHQLKVVGNVFENVDLFRVIYDTGITNKCRPFEPFKYFVSTERLKKLNTSTWYAEFLILCRGII